MPRIFYYRDVEDSSQEIIALAERHILQARNNIAITGKALITCLSDENDPCRLEVGMHDGNTYLIRRGTRRLFHMSARGKKRLLRLLTHYTKKELTGSWRFNIRQERRYVSYS